MARAKKDTSDNVKLADFTPTKGEVVDAMLPNDTKIREREVKKIPTVKQGITEPIIRTDLR